MTLRPVWLAGAFLGALALHAAIFLQFEVPDASGAAPDGDEGILVALGTPPKTGAGDEDTAEQNVEEVLSPEAAPPEPLNPETAAIEPEQPDGPTPDIPSTGPAGLEAENAPPEATSVEIPVDAVSEIPEADLTEPVPEPANVTAETEPDQPVPDPTQDLEGAPEHDDPPVDTGLAAAPLPEVRTERTALAAQRNFENQQARTDASSDAERADYLTRLHSQLVRSRRYPQSARRDSIEGVVQIGLTINRAGRVTAFRITSGSGFDILDEEVRNMIDRVQPLLTMPASMELSQITINMAIRFKLE